jgi:putative nucleotidyltransferase with HDIG domain
MDFKDLIELFERNGKELYIVGGAVRDKLLNKPLNDVDLTTNANMEEIRRILRSSDIKFWEVGQKVGSTIGICYPDKKAEISTFKPSCETIVEDLEHRDFTINSMAMDKDGKIIDPYSGMKDLKEKVVRATCSPSKRLAEDPVRMLRAIRFVSTLSFSLAEETRYFTEIYSHTIINTSKERWVTELTKLLVGKNVKTALELLFQTRLLGYILPEVYPITMIQRIQNLDSKDLWNHVKLVVDKSPFNAVVRWAALLHDIGKPQSISEYGGVHFFQHEHLGAEIADSLMKRLKIGGDIRRAIVGLVSLHQRTGDIVNENNKPPVSISALRRLVRDCDNYGCNIKDLVELFAADCSSSRMNIVERQDKYANLLREALIRMSEEDLKPQLPSGLGNEIMRKYDLSPGPQVGEKMKKLDSLLINGVIKQNDSPQDMLKVLEESER